MLFGNAILQHVPAEGKTPGTGGSASSAVTAAGNSARARRAGSKRFIILRIGIFSFVYIVPETESIRLH